MSRKKKDEIFLKNFFKVDTEKSPCTRALKKNKQKKRGDPSSMRQEKGKFVPVFSREPKTNLVEARLSYFFIKQDAD